MPVPDRERSRHMALRLGRAAAREGIREISLLETAHALAMEPRHRLLDDDHDPRYLHPGRTALVALGDGGIREPRLLAAGLLLETLTPELAPSPEDVREAERESGVSGVQGAWDTAAAIPRPGDEDLVERLVTAAEGERVLALCEWLDQLRHLRNWGDPVQVALGQRLTREVYLPLAERTRDSLARRFRWWMRRVDPGLRGAS